MKSKFDYEEKYMGLPDFDTKTGEVKVSSRYETRLWSLAREVGKTKGKILDVGCGAGGFINSLKFHYPGFNCYGCDISQAAIRFARKVFNSRINFRAIKNNRLPYPSDYFDIVILIHVLEHVEEKDQLLKEIHRVLKKEGLFHLQMPCEANPLTFTRLKWGQQLTGKYWGHLDPMTDRKVIALVKKHKFSLLKKSYDTHLLSQLFLLIGYFLPKVSLDFFLGRNRALDYTDLRVKTKRKPGFDPFLLIRRAWVKLISWPTSLVRYLELFFLKSVRLTALNFHLTAQKA